MWIYRYDSNGKILSGQFWRESRALPDGEMCVVSEAKQSIGDIYVDVDTKIIKTKQVYNYTMEVRGFEATITGLPVGCVVEVVKLGEVIADSEPTILEFDMAGEYLITFSKPFGYKEEMLEVTVG